MKIFGWRTIIYEKRPIQNFDLKVPFLVPETWNFGKPKNTGAFIMSKKPTYQISSKSDEVEKSTIGYLPKKNRYRVKIFGRRNIFDEKRPIENFDLKYLFWYLKPENMENLKRLVPLFCPKNLNVKFHQNGMNLKKVPFKVPKKQVMSENFQNPRNTQLTFMSEIHNRWRNASPKFLIEVPFLVPET